MKKVLYIFTFLLLVSCGNNSDCKKSIHFKMKNLTGLDGCGWVMQKDDDSYLEVQNFDEFEIDFTEGKEYHISYNEVEGASICMAGDIVELTCISED